MVARLDPTTVQARAVELQKLIEPARADGVISSAEATRVLASAVEAKIPYAQAQSALRAAGFTGTANLGWDVHSKIQTDTSAAQTILHQLGFLKGEGVVDGRAGAATTKALLAFQSGADPKLPATGVLDSATKAALTQARDKSNLAWARQRLPEAQHHYDTLTQGKTHLGFDQHTIASLSDHLASANNIDTAIVSAARQVAHLTLALSGAERGEPRQAESLATLRAFNDAFESAFSDASVSGGSIVLPEEKITL